MKKRLFAALVALLLAACLLPATAFAVASTSSVWVGDVVLTASTPYWKNGAGAATADATGYNAYFDAESGTLTLKDAMITKTSGAGGTSYAFGIHADGDLNLVLEGVSTMNFGSTITNRYGLYVVGTLTVSGEGSLTATAEASTDGNYIIGVYVGGSITINSGSLTATVAAATTGSSSYGVYSKGAIEVKAGGTLSGTGGTVTGKYGNSYGIYAAAGINNSGTIKGTGGKATDTEISSSYGIYADTDIINSGTVTGNGGWAKNNSYGIYTEKGKIEMTGGTMTGTGSGVDNGSMTSYSYGVYTADKITVSAGTLTGEGDTAYTQSYGVFSSDGGITVSGKGTLKGTGGFRNSMGAGGGSCGVYSYDGKVTVSDTGTLEGKAGKATGGLQNYSCGVIGRKGITVEGGSITGTGDAAQKSYGVKAESALTISAGTITGIGGSASYESYENGESYGVYATQITAFGTGKLEGTGGTATGTSGASYGVYALLDDITVSDTSALTGTGGAATDTSGTSCGVYSKGGSFGADINVSGGTIKGTSGAAATASGLGATGSIWFNSGTLTAITSSGSALSESPILPDSYRWRLSDSESYTDSDTKAYALANDQPYIELTTLSAPTPTRPGGYSPDYNDYVFSRGARGVWQRGSSGGLSFTVNGSLSMFVKATVDGGPALTAEQAEIVSGSTVITLKPAYLATLSVGEHTLRAVYTDGYAETTFTVGAQDNSNPQTGANDAIALAAGLALAALCAAGCVLQRKKK